MKQTILILGATSDIARAIAHRYAREGSAIQLAARDSGRLEKETADLNIRYGTEVTTWEFDAEAYETHGSFCEKLPVLPDVVFCVFGFMSDQKVAEKDFDAAHRMLRINYTGAVSILSHLANLMETRGSGTIVGISSVAGDRGRASNYFYGSAKAGFTAFLSGLRNRLAAKGVQVITAKPGYVNTAMTAGMNLPGPLTSEPEAVANALFSAVKKKKNVVYISGVWRLIMLIIRNIPEFVFKKLKL
ncbi:MAG: SDR family oxidoreductase [Bacteroidia bacterium]|nr:SDR family oxidoreductase [Bacteroidia bacterium]